MTQRIYSIFQFAYWKHAPMMIKNTSQGVDERKCTSTTSNRLYASMIEYKYREVYREIYSEKAGLFASLLN